jgi:hypothetical protein
MKKNLLFISSLALGVTAIAQQAQQGWVKLAPAVANRTATYVAPSDNTAPANTNAQSNNNRAQTNPSVSPLFTETVIGNTTYPLQTNSSNHTRLVNNGGMLSAAWTFSAGAWNAWSDRGTGYNYFDGTTWGAIPTTRLENDRTGFTNIVAGSFGEMTVAHNTNAMLNHFVTRTAIGSGTWGDNTSLISAIPNWTYGTWWPQLASSGTYIHHIALTAPTGLASGGGPFTNGQDGAIVYSRSSDGGATFAVQNQVPAAFDQTHSVGYGGDSYVMDASGSTVALVAGGFGEDVMLAKSVDNGTTWTTDTIHDFPITLFSDQVISDVNNDGLADTVDTNDGSLAVLVDNNGMVHVWYGFMRILEDDIATAGISYFPASSGIMYWNESFTGPPVVIADLEDVGNDQVINIADWGTYQVALTSHPSAGIDAAGNIYLTYDAAVDGSDDGNGKAYRNVYVTASTDGGATWVTPVNVSPDNFYEKVFPTMARTVDANVHIIYQKDDRPGHGIGTTNPDTDNAGVVHDIVYVAVPTAALVGINEENIAITNMSVYPNPSTEGTATLGVTLNSAEEVTVNVVNAIGQTVTSNVHNMNAGLNTVNINTANLGAGVYFVNVITENGMRTERLIVQ